MGRSHDLASSSRGPESTGRGVRARGPARVATIGLDPLSDVLWAVRLTGACFFRVDASSPWWAEVPDAAAIGPGILTRAQQLVSYHVVTRGRCWAGLRDGTGVWLQAGDVLVVPHGDCYALATAPGSVGEQPVGLARDFFGRLVAGELDFTISEGGGGPGRVEVLCGFLGCDALPFDPILSLLPRLLRVAAPEGRGNGQLARLVQLAMEVSRERSDGSDGMLLRICELMFVEVLRRYVRSLPKQGTGWLAGLRDPVVRRALAHLHRDPARAWTLGSLARAAGVSRSLLAERFAHVVGQPPMRYLTGWRIQLGARRLSERDARVGAVALDVGYESEAAFSRAFKRAMGVSPAAWRDGRRKAES